MLMQTDTLFRQFVPNNPWSGMPPIEMIEVGRNPDWWKESQTIPTPATPTTIPPPRTTCPTVIADCVLALQAIGHKRKQAERLAKNAGATYHETVQELLVTCLRRPKA